MRSSADAQHRPQLSQAYCVAPNDKGGEELVESVAAGFFSLEMSNDQLNNRILAEQAGVPSRNIRAGELSNAPFDHYLNVIGALEGLPLYIDEHARGATQ